MKTTPAFAAPWWAAVLFILALTLLAPLARAASASPPDYMTYQGFLVDVNGVALGNTAPKNYDVIFRIWNAQSAGDKLWAEQQTLTVDKGYFSVLLGEGSQAGSEARPPLSTLFGATDDVSDRFVEITVKGIGTVDKPDVTILPRLRLLTSPYAFLAKNAVALVSGTNPVVTTKLGYVGIHTDNPGAQLDVNGTVKATALNVTGAATAATLNVTGTVTAASFVGSGAALTNLDASKIASGMLDSARIPTTFTGDRTFTGGTVDVRSNVKMFSVQPANSSTWKPTATGQKYTIGPASTDGFLSVVLWPSGTIGDDYVNYVSATLAGWGQPLGAAGVSSVSGVEFGSKVNSFMVPVQMGNTCELTYVHIAGVNSWVIVTWTALGQH